MRVEGDSRAPTLDEGDDILVDGGDAAARLRDGIYVLRMDDVLMVKRIARAPGQGRISVLSDNPHYRSWDDLPLAAIQLVRRVAWTGRRVSCASSPDGHDRTLQSFPLGHPLSSSRSTHATSSPRRCYTFPLRHFL